MEMRQGWRQDWDPDLKGQDARLRSSDLSPGQREPWKDFEQGCDGPGLWTFWQREGAQSGLEGKTMWRVTAAGVGIEEGRETRWHRLVLGSSCNSREVGLCEPSWRSQGLGHQGRTFPR